MTQYYTDAFYTSERALKRNQRLDMAQTIALMAAVLLLGYQGYKNSGDIIDLKYHRHESHGAQPVNSDGEYLYLSGAWF